MKKGKRIIDAKKTVEKGKLYDLSEAIKLVKENANAKFDESVEVHVNLNINPSSGEQAIRSTVVLPHGVGKDVRVCVIAKDDVEAKKAGADVIGGEDLIAQIKTGKLPDVDVIVTTPDMMPKLASAAKVLGPRGLMPSPKTDTVTTNITETVSELKKGKESFKNDKGACIHQIIGKASFDEKKLEENYNAFINAVLAQKTDAHKGKLIKSVFVCSTMGPSVKVKF